MSSRFVVASFLGLGWTFYELSGGADFAPPERPEIVAETPAAKVDAPAVTLASASTAPTSNPKEVVPVADVERPVADPALRRSIAREQLAQIGGALGTDTAFDGRIPTGGLQLVSLEGGLSAITTQPVAPIVETVAIPEPQGPDVRYVRASRVNMRQGPGTNYSVLTRLLANDKVIVLEDNGAGWLRLKVDNSNRVGWIAASLLTKKAP
ncbi:SH3 domain-containing protein [Epibacterium ulvae]|uniref:SH3 domain-containing protein n=1 Tax=Epibacterium ulvae TaxID=1156985 RepID=UPI001BFC2EE1|nr:SH3 domain-containing protein [Epibacterium ulvae]MBT8153410.1 SH3 domain-containing protein [Epibacterium ulvae]